MSLEECVAETQSVIQPVTTKRQKREDKVDEGSSSSDLKNLEGDNRKDKTFLKKNEYTGWRLPFDGAPIERRAYAELSPRKFYTEFIQARRPVVIFGGPSADSDFRSGFALWTSAYLKDVAGHVHVQVEKRQKPDGAFGLQAEKIKVKFSDFVDAIDRGARDLYLTTQDLDADEEGRPALMSSPVLELFSRDDTLTPTPAIMGNLVPVNVNLWWGSSTTPTSSGLHHDFHDNLYCLLRGSKRFEIYSPADAFLMKVTGKMESVHPNGRINYEGQLTFPDGSDQLARNAMEADLELMEAESELEKAQASGDEVLCEVAEKRLELALERTLDVEAEDFLDDDADGDGSIEDCLHAEAEVGSVDTDNDCKPTDERPLNFCHHVSDDATKTEVTLYPGDILYLPSGYFHEVFSSSDCLSAASSNRSASTGGVACSTGENESHQAINYWLSIKIPNEFHPPDGPSFEKPYSSDFWRWDFERRQRINSRCPEA